MMNNIWCSKALVDTLLTSIKGKRDKIPAICDGEEGILLVSLTDEEVKKALSSVNKVEINCSGVKTAQIKDTSIVVDVNKVRAL